MWTENKRKQLHEKLPDKDCRTCGECQHIPIKTVESVNGNYNEYEIDGYTYFQQQSLEIILRKGKKILWGYNWRIYK